MTTQSPIIPLPLAIILQTLAPADMLILWVEMDDLFYVLANDADNTWDNTLSALFSLSYWLECMYLDATGRPLISR